MPQPYTFLHLISFVFILHQFYRNSAIYWGWMWPTWCEVYSGLNSRLDETLYTRHRPKNRWENWSKNFKIPCIWTYRKPAWHGFRPADHLHSSPVPRRPTPCCEAIVRSAFHWLFETTNKYIIPMLLSTCSRLYSFEWYSGVSVNLFLSFPNVNK